MSCKERADFVYNGSQKVGAIRVSEEPVTKTCFLKLSEQGPSGPRQFLRGCRCEEYRMFQRGEGEEVAAHFSVFEEVWQRGAS